MSSISTEKPSKVFISHSIHDMAFVLPLIEMFEKIGLNPDNMFCSSVPGFNIPLDNNIFDYLKAQFQDYNLRVIYILSENYYKSAASLNEMGAAWVLQHKYTSILVPKFEFKDIKGAIDQMRISIKLDADKAELKSRLNELKDSLTRELNLNINSRPYSIWERHRDKFVETINSTEVYWTMLSQLKANNRPPIEWISPLKKLIEVNPSSYDAMYMLGTVYLSLQDTDNAIRYLRMVVTLSKSEEIRLKALQKLQSIGYVI